MKELNQKYYLTLKFDENSNLNTMYLGRVDMTRLDKLKVEEKFPTSEQG